MSETGFKCPKCGQTEYFEAHAVILTGRTLISPDGWDFYECPNDVDLYPGTTMKCDGCGYEAVNDEFKGKR